MPPSHAKMRLKSAPQKLNVVMAKAISKSFAIDVAANALNMHSNTVSFLMKTTLCEINNVIFSKNC